jgi:hypothetical protein
VVQDSNDFRHRSHSFIPCTKIILFLVNTIISEYYFTQIRI